MNHYWLKKKKEEKVKAFHSDLTEDISGIPGSHEVWGVCSQSQHSLALDLLLQRLLVLSLKNTNSNKLLPAIILLSKTGHNLFILRRAAKAKGIMNRER